MLLLWNMGSNLYHKELGADLTLDDFFLSVLHVIAGFHFMKQDEAFDPRAITLLGPYGVVAASNDAAHFIK